MRLIFKKSKTCYLFQINSVTANIILMFVIAINFMPNSSIISQNQRTEKTKRFHYDNPFYPETTESRKKPLHKKHPTMIVLSKKQGHFLHITCFIKRRFLLFFCCPLLWSDENKIKSSLFVVTKIIY